MTDEERQLLARWEAKKLVDGSNPRPMEVGIDLIDALLKAKESEVLEKCAEVVEKELKVAKDLFLIHGGNGINIKLISIHLKCIKQAILDLSSNKKDVWNP